MQITFKIGKKKHTFPIEKRNVKIYKIGKEYKVIQYNFGDNEIIFPYNNVELVFYAEMYNGCIEHINLIKAEVTE